MATVSMPHEDNNSQYANRTWLEKVKDIVEVTGNLLLFCKISLLHCLSKVDSVVVQFHKKGRSLLFKRVVNYLSSAVDKEVGMDV